MRSDAPDSVAAIAVHVDRPYIQAVWSPLGEAVRTGENAFRLVHGVSGFGRFETIVGVGGGNGTLLAALRAEHPSLR